MKLITIIIIVNYTVDRINIIRSDVKKVADDMFNLARFPIICECGAQMLFGKFIIIAIDPAWKEHKRDEIRVSVFATRTFEKCRRSASAATTLQTCDLIGGTLEELIGVYRRNSAMNKRIRCGFHLFVRNFALSVPPSVKCVIGVARSCKIFRNKFVRNLEPIT